MKRNRAITAFILLSLLVAVLCWYANRAARRDSTLAVSSPSEGPKSEIQNIPRTNNGQPQDSDGGVKLQAHDAGKPDPGYTSYYEEQRRADPHFDWKQPINFYGRVVDESNQPVAGATANFQWTDTSKEGTSDASAVSDSNGRFSLLDRRGKRLTLSVAKEGYYSAGAAKVASFEYANPYEGRFVPEPENPVLFVLRKKGPGTSLITSQYGFENYFRVTMPLDGTPAQVDLLERKIGRGQLQVTQIKPEYKNWKQATNWIFRMEIADGGFVAQNDEFPFQAPEAGYQPVVEFDFQRGEASWATELKTNYYIKFGNPPKYGTLRLDTSIMMEGARLTYAINPDGSRYLEPK